jgi:D-alanyl-D-alanine carboxypeptidase
MSNKRRIRWDRIVGAAIVPIVLIFLLGSCISRCSKEDEGTLTEQSSTEDVAEQTGSQPADTPATTTTAVSTTFNGAEMTMINVPIVITDDDGTENPILIDSSSTSSEATESSEPVNTLPAGYQSVPVRLSAMYAGNLVLVNKDNPSHLSSDELALEQVYFAEDKPDSYEISYPGHTSLNSTALSQFNRLMKAYFSATGNKEIMFNYGYLAADKEKSNPDSPTGLDVQLHIKRNDGGYEYITNAAPYSWVYEHMASYGYVLRYPAEKADITGERGGFTAIRYVGVPHAAYMDEENLCLEEYLDRLKKDHNFFTGTPLEYELNKQVYRIYYVPVDSTTDGDPTVPVPNAGSYEISGNNSDGFIVTAIVG